MNDLLDSLEQAALRDADHVDLWNFLTSLSFAAYVNDDVSVGRHAFFARRAAEADPSDPTARYNLGEAHMALEEPERALPEFTAAAEHPEYSHRHYVHMARGIVAYHLGENEAARDAYARAVELQPSARGHLYLADAHRRLGDEEQARRHYRRALKMQPTLVDAHRGYWYAELPDDMPPNSTTLLPSFGSGRRGGDSGVDFHPRIVVRTPSDQVSTERVRVTSIRVCLGVPDQIRVLVTA